MTAPARWIGLAGPTAAGKTAIALALAEVLPLEIVSVDSALVYKGMDIGSAKPTRAERARVPHHLIDILDPSESYSVARFAADAKRLIGEISARGRLPLLVGGSMLYFKALIDGLDTMPAANPALRAQLDAEAGERGWPALHAQLACVDPATAARLPPNDAQRIQRALEVWRGTGRPISSFQRTLMRPTTPAPLISLEPRSRAWLHERIAQRFQAMLAGGLVDEVQRLRARGDLHLGLPSMRCVGYRQVWEALDGGAGTPLPHTQILDRGVAATRQLAKRQLTWLRNLPAHARVACDEPDALAQVTAWATELRRALKST
jgi:tRNA dimethylallyltransferase